MKQHKQIDERKEKHSNQKIVCNQTCEILPDQFNDAPPVDCCNDYWSFWLDIEHTGGKKSNDGLAICQLCIRDTVYGQEFTADIKPIRNNQQVHITPIVQSLTGLTDEYLANKPSFEQIWPPLQAFIGRFPAQSFIFLSHNSKSCDGPRMNAEIAGIGKKKPLNWYWVDTLPLVKKIRKQNTGNSLKNLYKECTGTEMIKHMLMWMLFVR